MLGFIARALVSGFIIAIVAQLAPKFPRIGALVLSLPLVSIGALLFMWFQDENLASIARFSYETIILVPLGLVFFLPLILSEKVGIGFWPAFISGIVLCALVLGLRLWWGGGR